MALTISPSVVRAFRRDGAVLVKNVFGPEWIDILREGVAKNLAAPGPYARHYTSIPERSSSGGGDIAVGHFFGDYCNWRRIPEYENFLKASPAADVAGALMGSPTVVLFHEHVLVKEPLTSEKTPWHHDLPYYCVEARQTCSLWVPLDPVKRENCVEFVKGSHRWGRLFRPAKFKENEQYAGKDGDDTLHDAPDVDARRDEFDLLGWDVEPGDAVAFSFLTLHGAPGNASSSTRRRAFAARYVGEDAVFASRRGEISPPFPNVTLNHGDPLRGDDFPVVRCSAGGT